MALRIIFMGTPDFSVPTLRALKEAGHEIVAVYTQPPRPGGRRGLDLQKSPVHQAAELLGIPVLTPLNFKDPEERAVFAPMRRMWRWWWPTASCCRSRFSKEHDSAATTAMPRFCRAGAVLHPSSGRSWPATTRPA